MKPMSHKEALILLNEGLITEDSLAAGINAGLVSPPGSNLREYISDRGERISLLLKELKPFKLIEFSRSKDE